MTPTETRLHEPATRLPVGSFGFRHEEPRRQLSEAIPESLFRDQWFRGVAESTMAAQHSVDVSEIRAHARRLGLA